MQSESDSTSRDGQASTVSGVKTLGYVLRYVALNGAFAALLWYGFARDVVGARNAYIFFVWALALVSFGYYTKEVHESISKRQGWTVPRWLDVTYDLVSIGVLAWFGAFWTAGAVVFTALNIAHGHSEAKKLREAPLTAKP